MTKKTRIFSMAAILFSSLIIFNTSCNKDETTPDNEPPVDDEISENAVIIDDYDLELLSDSIELAGGIYKYQFTGEAPDLSNGDVLVSQSGDGYLRIVTSTSVNNDEITLETEQGTLIDLFVNSTLSVDIPFESKKNSGSSIGYEEIYLADGITVIDGDGINFSISNVEFKLGDFALKVNSGTVNIVPHIKYKHVSDNLTIKKVELTSYNTEFNFENNITITGTITEGVNFDPKLLFEAKTYGVLPVFPYAYYVVHKVYLKFEPTVNMGLDYNYSSTTNYVFDMGVLYENESFDPFFEKKSENHNVINSALSVHAGGSIKLSLVYEPTFYLWGIKGPYLENSGFGELKGAISSENDWDLSMGFGAESKIGLKYNIYDKYKLDISKTFDLGSIPIYAAPDSIKIISGINQSGLVSETLSEPIRVKVVSSSGSGVSNVKVYFAPETGSGTTGDEFAFTNADGIAETTWTLGSEAGTQKLNVFAKKGDGTFIKDAPVQFTAMAEESEEEIFTDPRDGQTYNIVTIGSQTWFAENLNYETTNSWWYDNSSTNGDVYGRLYTWNAALTACPNGWHLPSDDEWTILSDYLGGSSSAGGKMKEAGTEHWIPPNTGATNSSGFSALPAGTRTPDGTFDGIGEGVSFWSSTAKDEDYAWIRFLIYTYSEVYRLDNFKSYGFSCRCLQD